jgi:hypothetical protein
MKKMIPTLMRKKDLKIQIMRISPMKMRKARSLFPKALSWTTSMRSKAIATTCLFTSGTKPKRISKLKKR